MSHKVFRRRRMSVFWLSIVLVIAAIVASQDMWQTTSPQPSTTSSVKGSAAEALKKIPIKGRAPKTGYERTHFGDGWLLREGCDTRNIILNRDLENVRIGDSCKVLSGALDDPYTGKSIMFQRGSESSDDVQIDHVVALSDAWQKGAQQLSREKRVEFANDPLELLAVDGRSNQEKGDGDAATWLPPNKSFRCQYVARQVAIKEKYDLWVTQAEYDAIKKILSACPGQSLPTT